MSDRTTNIIGGIGRTLITLGCLTLAFAGFQLWGTGIAEGRAQSSLEEDFEARQVAFAEYAEEIGLDVAEVGSDPDPVVVVDQDPSPDPGPDSEPVTPPVPASSVPKELLPSPGDALGVIRIPEIGVDKVVIAGTRRSDLRKGPGHYGTTPLPGQAGNAAIAGHRTTYGAPFGDLDTLEPGDRIVVETFQGSFNYEVLPQETTEGVSGHSIVSPYDVEVLEDYGDNRLTLTACHPKYSARQRIVVQAKLVNPPAATIELAVSDLSSDEQPSDQPLAYEANGVDPDVGEPSAELDPAVAIGAENDEGNLVATSSEVLDESLGWHFEELTAFLVWSVLTGLAAGGAVAAAARWKRWPSYVLASPVVLPLLFLSFTHLDRMLPAF
jgi:sortase A